MIYCVMALGLEHIAVILSLFIILSFLYQTLKPCISGLSGTLNELLFHGIEYRSHCLYFPLYLPSLSFQGLFSQYGS